MFDFVSNAHGLYGGQLIIGLLAIAVVISRLIRSHKVHITALHQLSVFVIKCSKQPSHPHEETLAYLESSMFAIGSKV